MPGEGGADGPTLAALMALRVSATTCPDGSDEIARAICGSSSSMNPSSWTGGYIFML
jgi:hypothetical protein